MLKYRIVRKLRTIVLPGFDGIPILKALDFFFKGVVNGAITTRASAISFSMFSALFPALIFIFTLIPFIPIDNFQEVLLDLLHDIIPNKAWEAVEVTLTDIITRPRGGLLSLGFILALFFSTNGINSLIDAFNASYYTMENRGILMQRWVAVVLVLLLFMLLIVAISTITFSTNFFEYLDSQDTIIDNHVITIIQWIRWLVMIALTYFSISFIYYWGPAKKTPFVFFSAGSSLTTFFMMISNIGFNYYANNLARYNALYGSIGTLLLILLWIYFNSIIVLIGFELNVSILNAKLKIKSTEKLSDKEN